MRGYNSDSYGDGFADVYDDWYSNVTDVDATVARMVELACAGGRVLELGVGTGRLAVPMAQAGLTVTGVDSSAAMLEQLTRRDPANTVVAVHGDMVDDLPPGPFDAALVAYNTIFNLPDEARQREFFDVVAQRLRPGGAFVVEADVPDTSNGQGSVVALRSMTVNQVVLSVSEQWPDEQRASGQFIQLSEEGGVRLRPWSIRWASPDQLDNMATAAGLTLESRWDDMARTTYDEQHGRHVSTYRKQVSRPNAANHSEPECRGAADA